MICALGLTRDQHITRINAKLEILIAFLIVFDIQQRNKRISHSFNPIKPDIISLRMTALFLWNIKCYNFPFKMMAEFISKARLNGVHCSCPDTPTSHHYLIHIFIMTEQWGNGVPSVTDCQLETASITWSLSEEKEQGQHYCNLFTVCCDVLKTLAVIISRIVNEC